jgi:hypothetical protein
MISRMIFHVLELAQAPPGGETKRASTATIETATAIAQPCHMNWVAIIPIAAVCAKRVQIWEPYALNQLRSSLTEPAGVLFRDE